MFYDVGAHQDRLLVDPDFDASFDQLIETTPVTEFDISAGEVKILASRRIVSLNRAALSLRPSRTFWLGADDGNLS